MDLPNGSAGVLAQPTRARLFDLLLEHKTPVRTDVLAAGLGLHPNGVRRQLERLQEAGLVERRRVRRGAGRPHDEWSPARGASPGGERPRAYGDLAGWLARAIPASAGRLRAVERTGREIGRELVPAGGGGALEIFGDVFAALGFQPAIDVKADGSVRCRLCNCPYRDAVRANQEVVCGLHRGLTEGFLAELAPGARLRSFEPGDPDRAGCLVEVSGELARRSQDEEDDGGATH
jgi:predicted ArsR family transcriptional regulator